MHEEKCNHCHTITEKYVEKCAYCGINDATKYTVFCYNCLEKDRPDRFTKEQWIQILKNLRGEILKKALFYEDSTTIGDNIQFCNWGCCTDSAEVYNLPEYHQWPQSFKNHKRVAPLKKFGKCPLELEPTESEKKESYHGCFYRCRVFSGKKHGYKKLPTREETINLLDKKLKELEA